MDGTCRKEDCEFARHCDRVPDEGCPEIEEGVEVGND